jgi:pimeloyl-ACP methyl ester carboxylesterase
VDAIITPAGRRLEYFIGGDSAGFPLLFHVGTPMAARHFRPLDEAATRHGFLLVSYSRPGYGGSTPRPSGADSTMVDDVDDGVALLDALALERFVTAGWSGGGPRALACAAVLQDRCVAAASLAGPAPYNAQGLDFTAGMGEHNARDFKLCVRDPDRFRAECEQGAGEYEALTGEAMAATLESLLSAVDAEALTPELADWLAVSFRDGYRQGAVGAIADNLQLVRPWGFDLGAISVPVAVWHGRDDHFVPYSHGRWLATDIPGARPHLEERVGHLGLVARVYEVLGDLRDLAGVA